VQKKAGETHRKVSHDIQELNEIKNTRKQTNATKIIKTFL